jgi:hypothetical protein
MRIGAASIAAARVATTIKTATLHPADKSGICISIRMPTGGTTKNTLALLSSDSPYATWAERLVSDEANNHSRYNERWQR